MRSRAAGPYARAIEAALSRLLERPRLLSPREWALVADWHGRGVPLGVVTEVLEDVARRRSGRTRGASALRSLTYLAPAVEEAWQAIREGRASGAVLSPPPLPPRELLREAWRTARGRAGEGTALAALIDDLCARLDAGEDPAALDDALDAELEAAAPQEAVRVAERETFRALDAFRGRMPPKDFERTWRRARVDRLRALLELPRLALSR